MAGRAGGAALINVSSDNLGAVIKILSRWEVNRKAAHKTPARPMPTSPGSSSVFLLSSLFVLCVLGGSEGDTEKVRRQRSWAQGVTERDYTDLGGATSFLLSDKGPREPDAAAFVPRLPSVREKC